MKSTDSTPMSENGEKIISGFAVCICVCLYVYLQMAKKIPRIIWREWEVMSKSWLIDFNFDINLKNRNKLETKKKEISENDYKKSPGFLYKFFVFSFVFSSLLWAAGESEDPYILKKQSMQSIQYLETYT